MTLIPLNLYHRVDMINPAFISAITGIEKDFNKCYCYHVFMIDRHPQRIESMDGGKITEDRDNFIAEIHLAGSRRR